MLCKFTRNNLSPTSSDLYSPNYLLSKTNMAKRKYQQSTSEQKTHSRTRSSQNLGRRQKREIRRKTSTTRATSRRPYSMGRPKEQESSGPKRPQFQHWEREEWRAIVGWAARGLPLKKQDPKAGLYDGLPLQRLATSSVTQLEGRSLRLRSRGLLWRSASASHPSTTGHITCEVDCGKYLARSWK